MTNFQFFSRFKIFFEDRSRIDIEPAQLQPAPATTRTLHRLHRPKRAVEGIHTGGAGPYFRRLRTGQTRQFASHRRIGIACMSRFFKDGRLQAMRYEPVLRLAGRDPTTGMLNVFHKRLALGSALEPYQKKPRFHFKGAEVPAQ